MSNDFYFKYWKKTLAELKAVVDLDAHFQETKAHDKKRCEAAQRLSGVLGQYSAIYSKIWDCLHQNLQVQKTSYIRDVLSAVVSRILELKHQLRRLEASEYQFNSNGLLRHKLTPHDAELDEIPVKMERPENINTVLKDIFEEVKERKRFLEEEAKNEVASANDLIDMWWDVKDEEENVNINTEDDKVVLSEEQLEAKKLLELIQAHERTRQVTTMVRQQRNKRAKWKKELLGNLASPAPIEIRENGAKLIQRVCRKYFEIKREKIILCKQDELIGIRPCLKPKLENIDKWEQVKEYRELLKRQYDEEWKIECESLKQDYLKKKNDDLKEHYRDHIRDWFKIWYEAINFFHDIPGDKQGGAAMIFTENLPTPEEWLEDYKTYLSEKKANKGKTALDRKFAQMEINLAEKMAKKGEHMKKKMEEDLRKKLMKNPTLHPGFNFPQSKKTKHILEVIDKYDRDWAELDAADTLDVKENYIRDINISTAYMEAKLEIVSTVEEDMRNELKLLKNALKRDYENNKEKKPEPMKQKNKKGKKEPKVNKTLNLNITEQLEDLVFRQYLVEYPKTKIEQFIGDPNFTGDNMRCNYVRAFPHTGETRNIWWEKCLELIHGFHKILLVGPMASGKTMLVHVLASMNDAALFELDSSKIPEMFLSPAYLGQLVRSVASCAKAVQPSVIHIKHVQKLYYRKVPPEDAKVDWKLIQRYFVKKLFKNIHKTDKVTVLGSCVNPWKAKSNPLLRQFPTVVLMPNSSYGNVAQIIKDWVLRHKVIPTDFDVGSLARALQGYSFGFLKDAMEKFLAADTVIRIAARGLSPTDVYDFILQYEKEGKVDYIMYLKWYSEKTTWGKKEQKHIEEQMAFKQAVADFRARMEKKKQQESANNPTHT